MIFILLLLLFPFTTVFSIEKQFITNSKVPICKNCVYFKPYKYINMMRNSMT